MDILRANLSESQDGHAGSIGRSNTSPDRKPNSRKQPAPVRKDVPARLATDSTASKRARSGYGDALSGGESLGGTSMVSVGEGSLPFEPSQPDPLPTPKPAFLAISSPVSVAPPTVLSDSPPAPAPVPAKPGVPAVFNHFLAPAPSPAPVHHPTVAASASDTVVAKLAAEVADLQAKLASRAKDFEYLKESETNYKKLYEDTRRELESFKAADLAQKERSISSIADVVRELHEKTAASRRQQMFQNQFRLGRLVVQRAGAHGAIDVWEDGYEYKKLAADTAALASTKEAAEKQKKDATKMLKKSKTAAAASSSTAGAGTGEDHTEGGELVDLDHVLLDERLKVQLNDLKKQDAELTKRKEGLDAEKAVLLLEIIRAKAEDASPLNHRPLLNKRYLLLDLLGKGGFSEVWRALDCQEGTQVAVKVHRLMQSWSDQNKAAYIRHATREYTIHKSLAHDHVVRLFDVFEIDFDTFATVLEFCNGTDLEYVLKEQGTLSEREARAIMLQVLSALCYMNGCDPSSAAGGSTRSIIHYDLKPANILFDSKLGSNYVKVTDFGLSKILEHSTEGAGGPMTSMELTSLGAGTYWYLPPECFAISSSGSPPRISSKVDVWSLGVIFYQMLFGVRPFGEGKSQQAVLQEKVMLLASEVKFPEKPVVSADAKEFIKRCLTPECHRRPDVRDLQNDPYVRKKMKSK